MKYKTELHCHTSEISACSRETGAEVAAKYIAHGYTTLVVTNHFEKWSFEHRFPGDTWNRSSTITTTPSTRCARRREIA